MLFTSLSFDNGAHGSGLHRLLPAGMRVVLLHKPHARMSSLLAQVHSTANLVNGRERKFRNRQTEARVKYLEMDVYAYFTPESNKGLFAPFKRKSRSIARYMRLLFACSVLPVR